MLLTHRFTKCIKPSWRTLDFDPLTHLHQLRHPWASSTLATSTVIQTNPLISHAMALILHGDPAPVSVNTFWQSIPASTATEPNHLAELIAGLTTAAATLRQESRHWQASDGDYHPYTFALAASAEAARYRQCSKQITDQLARVLGHLIPSLAGCDSLTQTLGKLTTGDRDENWSSQSLNHAIGKLPISSTAKTQTFRSYRSAVKNRVIGKRAVENAIEELQNMGEEASICLSHTEDSMVEAADSCKKWLEELRDKARQFETSVRRDPTSWSEGGVIYGSLQDHLKTVQGQRGLWHLCKEVIRIDLAWDLLQHAVS